MSGFFGVFSPGGRFDQVAFDQMKSEFHRDGYDELATYVDNHIALGHLMLRVAPESVNDKQPLSSLCGRYSLVGHFRLDYRDELGDKLGLMQKELELTPDSQLVMLSYQKWGDKCVSHIEGDWTFLVYDKSLQSLFFAKDPTGISAFFYAIYDGQLYFSTDPNVFSSCNFFPQELDEAQFAYYSVNGLKFDKGSTLLKYVKTLPNGFTATINGSLEVQLSQFYNLSSNQEQKKYRYDFDVAYDFKSIYFNAVKSRCRCITEIGLYLSSGLDSMSVATLSSNELKKSGHNLYTFTSVPALNAKLTDKEKQFADESNLVNLFSGKKDNVRSIFLSFDDFKLSEVDLKDLRMNPFNPSVTLNSFWINGILKEAKRSNIRLMLTGQMGNFTVSADGYLVHLEMLFRLHFLNLYKAIKHYADKKRLSFLKAFRIRVLSVLKFNIRSWLNKRSIFKNNFFVREGSLSLAYYKKNRELFKSKLNDLIPGYASFFSSRKLRISQLRKNIYYSNIYWALYGKSYGIDITDPTSDRRVIEFSLTISDAYFFRDGEPKFLYKKMFKNLLPKEIVENTVSKIQSFDFGDRIQKDIALKELVLQLDDKFSHPNQELSGIISGNLNSITSSSHPNYERRNIIKLLHDISTINYLINFKKD
jgi:asparagine synthase (glutamine-hydrolysing)